MICEYIDNHLHIEQVPLSAVASQYGTPCYVYSEAQIINNYRLYDDAFGQRAHSICYAVKANSNIAVLNILQQLGAGFDVVSVGELERVHAAGAQQSEVVFAGAGKMRQEIERALALNISCINVESVDELNLINQIAGAVGKIAPVAIRVNPDVDPQTHPYISTGLNENKFGVPMPDAAQVYAQAARLPAIKVVGVACHIGSQLTDLAPFTDAAARVQILVNSLVADGINIEHIDIGGGLGIRYGQHSPPAIADYVAALCRQLDPAYRIVVEPGRSIVGDAGLLLTEVLYMKQTPAKLFAIVDASMSELIRPALYQAEHPVIAVNRRADVALRTIDIVGPVCETADFLAKERQLAITENELLAVLDAGAYGAVMASSYNTRPKPPEVMIRGSQTHLIRARDTIASLIANEQLIE